MSVRAKMRCIEVSRSCDNCGSGGDAVKVRLQPVYHDCEENKVWSKWTPSGELMLQITNPEASAQFEIGKLYFVDCVAAE